MSTPRLTFLYPMLFRSVQAFGSQCSRNAPSRRKLRAAQAATFTTSIRNRQEVKRERYGTANEPPAHLSSGNELKGQDGTEGLKQTDRPSGISSKERNATSPEKENKKPPTEYDVKPESQKEEPPPKVQRKATGDPDDPKTKDAPGPHQPPKTGQSNPMETVLEMPSPSEDRDSKHKPPHLQPPPYVHHFDTYSLVKDLEKSGFKLEQSVTVMKAVRGILADNMELAREGLVGKSDVENETYLFRAACSELRTEIQNSRKVTIEKMRQERAQLQHEVDILNQRLGQETAQMKDDLKGAFDDRKMNVKTEQRAMESRIQELNHKITVHLNSDARTDVESVRWVLTRRAAGAIGLIAFSVITVLKLFSDANKHEKEREKEREREGEHEEGHGGNGTRERRALEEGFREGRSNQGDIGVIGGTLRGGDGLIVGEGGVSLG
ncbi:hypothetical protein M501DRAFT_972589 [Patellaria atrata CBS 101060]|uniref:DUF1640-domain-containing protein n=1 Tax=Patellaria atrata CBS 101060 TaxID=1346257 RepID=A0A9P4SEL6_9PEZI|nr:hypothetical protein M501DRAFT_972589 [Patellaria atrata CBS 101060]